MTSLPPRAGFQLATPGAAAYDERLVPAFFLPCAVRLLELTPPAVGDRVLDLAGGTGAVARLAAPAVGPAGSVLVVDVNPAMIAYGSAQPRQSPTPIHWRRADAAALPVPEESVDVVYCQQGLQFFADPDQALAEVARVLVPGGRFAAAVWRSLPDNPAFAAFVDVLPRHLPAPAAASLRAAFRGPHGRALADLLAAAGLVGIRTRLASFEARFDSPRTFFEAEVAGSPLAGPVAGLSAPARDRLAGDVDRALQSSTDDDGLVLLMQTWLVTARRSC